MELNLHPWNIKTAQVRHELRVARTAKQWPPLDHQGGSPTAPCLSPRDWTIFFWHTEDKTYILGKPTDFSVIPHPFCEVLLTSSQLTATHKKAIYHSLGRRARAPKLHSLPRDAAWAISGLPCSDARQTVPQSTQCRKSSPCQKFWLIFLEFQLQMWAEAKETHLICEKSNSRIGEKLWWVTSPTGKSR